MRTLHSTNDDHRRSWIVSLGSGQIIIRHQHGTIELTWNSRPGKTYGIFYSLNLEDFDADVDDGIIGEEGETTSYSFENPEPGVPKIFFRVVVMDE